MDAFIVQPALAIWYIMANIQSAVGPSVIAYALLAAIISISSIAVVTLAGASIRGMFTSALSEFSAVHRILRETADRP